MKTLFDELTGLFAGLRDAWRHTAWRTGRRLQRPAVPGPAAAPPGPPPEELHIETLAREFPRELFAQLLLELPGYRRQLADSYAAGDYRRLHECVHQILGATAYCEAAELERGLRNLRLALKAGDDADIATCYLCAMQAIDNTLDSSGYRQQAE